MYCIVNYDIEYFPYIKQGKQEVCMCFKIKKRRYALFASSIDM